MKKNYKKIMIKALFCGALVSFTACSTSDTTTDDTTTTEEVATEAQQEDHTQHEMGAGEMDGMMGHMHTHMQDVKNMQFTGDPDYDFAKMMTLHQEGGIKMAEMEISDGTDAMLKQMAERIVNSNREEIRKLEEYTSNNQPSAGDTAATRKMMQPMKNMMGKMDHKTMMSGSTDQHFAQMMSRHHEHGMEMVRMYLQQGKSSELKSMAQQMMDQTQKQKQEFDSWLSQNKQ